MSVDKIKGLTLMQKRLDCAGGPNQQDRMIVDKRKTLDIVMQASYHTARVKRIGDIEIANALINPNQLKQDYDEKIISIGYEYNFQPGDVFEWMNTDTKWLIYLQELTELAYFRGNIRKCSYEISWEDEFGILHTTYAAIRGPQEQGMKHIQKAGISMDLPNYTLQLLLPNNEHTIKYFERYSKFYLKELVGSEANTCWRVEARDSISTPGILEIYAIEYYANKDTDDIEQGIVNGLIDTPISEEVSLIEGESIIKPRKSYTYIYQGVEKSEWLFDTLLPIEAETQDNKITVKWTQNYIGEFKLQYGTSTKTVVVESLF